MNPKFYLLILFLHSIITYGILGDIQSGFKKVYKDVSGAVSSGVKGAISIGGGIAKGVAKTGENIFIGNFINYLADPIINYISQGILDFTRVAKETLGDIFGILIGVPLGFINFISGFLAKLGIIGIPAEAAIIGIMIVVIIGIGLGIIKLVQILGDIL